MQPLFLACCLFACRLVACVTAADTRPNVVVIVADDLRYDELGCTGHPINQTPTLDALARDPGGPLPCGSASPWKSAEQAFYRASGVQ